MSPPRRTSRGRASLRTTRFATGDATSSPAIPPAGGTSTGGPGGPTGGSGGSGGVTGGIRRFVNVQSFAGFAVGELDHDAAADRGTG